MASTQDGITIIVGHDVPDTNGQRKILIGHKADGRRPYKVLLVTWGKFLIWNHFDTEVAARAAANDLWKIETTGPFA